MLVCPNCFKNGTLKNHIVHHGEGGDCDTCGRTSTLVLEAGELEELFEPLSRLYSPAMPGEHYVYDPEDEVALYGDEGELLEDLVQEWDIFSEDIIDEIPSLLSELWPGYESGTLYASDDLWYVSPDDDFQTLARKLMHERRWFAKSSYEADVNIDDLLDHRLEDFLVIPEEGEVWYRARKHDRWLGSAKPDAYPTEKMGCPPKERVTRGMRANPAGIPYLYLASDEPTVVAEVRAFAGDYLSIGKFPLPRGLRLIDLAQDLKELDPFEHADLKWEIERRSLLREFGKWLSKPVRDEDHEIDYVVTQFLAEYIAHKGFDGIIFKSAMADGRNLVLFDPSKTSCSSVSLKLIKRVRFDYKIKDVTED